MIIDKNKIIWINIQSGVVKYKQIMEFIENTRLENSDLSINESFRKNYNNFYVMMKKPKIYYDFYYSLLNTKKSISTNFTEILEELYTVQNHFESSFSSKLLHSINPNFPIWDKIVMEKLDLIIKVYPKNAKEKKETIIKQYEKLSNFYDKFLISSEGRGLISRFDDMIDTKDFEITPLKKIDFIIWQTR
jgi:hypothetical protein